MLCNLRKSISLFMQQLCIGNDPTQLIRHIPLCKAKSSAISQMWVRNLVLSGITELSVGIMLLALQGSMRIK